MDEAVTYYAVALKPGERAEPDGLARRRRLANGGIQDEMLRRDLTWKSDGLIAEWRRGDAVEELTEVSEAEALRLMERFREKWGAGS